MRVELDHRTYDDGTTGLTLSLEATGEVDGIVEPQFDLGPWLLAFERMVLRTGPPPKPTPVQEWANSKDYA